jgi:putative component of membrane protein insertase Oxa1/YidC/SpoIIIJ protein YidD
MQAYVSRMGKSDHNAGVAVTLLRTAMILAAILVCMNPAKAAQTHDPHASWDPAILLPNVPVQTVETAQTSESNSQIHLLFTSYRDTVSKLRGHACSFEPSCSQYSEQAVEKFGLLKGIVMSADRLERCNACIVLDLYPRGTVHEDGETLAYDPVEDHDYWNSLFSNTTISSPASAEKPKAGADSSQGPPELAESKPQIKCSKVSWEENVLSCCTDHPIDTHNGAVDPVPVTDQRSGTDRR